MAQNSEQITVALTGDVSVAPYSSGLVLPVDLGALDAAFVNLGLTTEDGVTFTATPNVEEIRSWQKKTATRRVVTGRDVSSAFVLQQTNLDTFALAFGGGDWTEPSEGVYRYDPPADGDALAEYACVIDIEDGDKHGRVVIIRSTVNEAVETQFVSNNAAELPVTLAGLTPDGGDRAWYFLSDDDAFDAA
jgi:hypothetical protein